MGTSIVSEEINRPAGHVGRSSTLVVLAYHAAALQFQLDHASLEPPPPPPAAAGIIIQTFAIGLAIQLQIPRAYRPHHVS